MAIATGVKTGKRVATTAPPTTMSSTRFSQLTPRNRHELDRGMPGQVLHFEASGERCPDALHVADGDFASEAAIDQVGHLLPPLGGKRNNDPVGSVVVGQLIQARDWTEGWKTPTTREVGSVVDVPDGRDWARWVLREILAQWVRADDYNSVFRTGGGVGQRVQVGGDCPPDGERRDREPL